MWTFRLHFVITRIDMGIVLHKLEEKKLEAELLERIGAYSNLYVWAIPMIIIIVT